MREGDWKILAEYDGSDTLQRTFIYGNYIDEVLLMKAGANDYYYVHDHLYSPATLVNSSGTVVERYEYDAYGKPTIWNADFTTERDSSNYGNPYLFTGRRVDILDSGSLKLQYNRNRYYDYYSGRWLTHDPLGIVPNSKALNYFKPDNQYLQGLSLYEYVSSMPVVATDPWGLKYVLDGTYQLDGSDPDEKPFDGTWNTAFVSSPAIWAFLWATWESAHTLGITWEEWYGYHDAATYMHNYLHSGCDLMPADYHRILRVSKDARTFFIKELKRAMGAAEGLVDSSDPQPKQITTKGMTYHDPGIEDDENWKNAIHRYDTWGRGFVTKGKRRKNCCYSMRWTLHLTDIYDFDPIDQFPMWFLNYHGWAKYFRVRGDHTITITWAKGYQLEHDKKMDVIEGKLKPFPQCQ